MNKLLIAGLVVGRGCGRAFSRNKAEFLGSRPPQGAQLGAWEADFPPGVFGPEEGVTVSAWALDFSRGSYYYHLEGDREFPARSAMIQGESQRKFQRAVRLKRAIEIHCLLQRLSRCAVPALVAGNTRFTQVVHECVV
jgi:hypothetical protein